MKGKWITLKEFNHISLNSVIKPFCRDWCTAKVIKDREGLFWERIEADNSMFPAGILLMKGWLSQTFTASQSSRVCVTLINVLHTCFVIVGVDKIQEGQAMNRDSKASSKTTYLTWFLALHNIKNINISHNCLLGLSCICWGILF